MKLSKSKLLKENKNYILENVKLAKVYVSQGKLSENELKKLIEIDPTPTLKYVDWMSKVWVNEKPKPDFDDLRNKIEEYNTFVKRDKTEKKDINRFENFADLKTEIDYLNSIGAGKSVKDLESDWEFVGDYNLENKNLLIMCPHTHEASRKLGLSYFAYRSCGDGRKDSAWCTTYKAPDHFTSYYYNHNVTFYYVKVKSEDLMEKIKKEFPNRYKELQIVALAVLDNGKIDGYDGLDKQLSSSDVKKYTSIIGIE
jgi:hypothetical protein